MPNLHPSTDTNLSALSQKTLHFMKTIGNALTSPVAARLSIAAFTLGNAAYIYACNKMNMDNLSNYAALGVLVGAIMFAGTFGSHSQSKTTKKLTKDPVLSMN